MQKFLKFLRKLTILKIRTKSYYIYKNNMGKKILIGTKIGILVAIAIVGVILLSGCIEEPQKNNSVNTSSLDIFFPVQKTPADVCMSALLEDELVIHDYRLNEKIDRIKCHQPIETRIFSH